MNLKLTICRDNQKKIDEENLEMTIKYFPFLTRLNSARSIC